ncbi:MAG: ABC transporter permease [Clostridiaceae bacterium]|nr:ABC transporter permease [Clostridiaceae bacterium]
MQVFKLCIQIIKKNLPVLSIYVFVFLMVSLIVSASITKEQQKISTFNSSKSNIAFISEEDTPFINGLKDELGNIANFVDLPDIKEELQDALFFRSVSYILRIPEGFTERFMNGDDVTIEKIAVPDSFSNTYIDMCIDNYLNMAKLYVTSFDNITQDELVGYLKKDLSKNALVEVKTNGETSENHSYINYIFNYFSYSLLSVIILGMSTLILVFNNRDLKMRNGCSPMSSAKINLQFVLANLTFTFSSWAIMILLCLAVNFKNSFNMNIVYFILNSFIFAFCSASIS